MINEKVNLLLITLFFFALIHTSVVADPSWSNISAAKSGIFSGVGRSPVSGNIVNALELARRNAVWNLSESVMLYLDSLYQVKHPEKWTSEYKPEFIQWLHEWFKDLPSKEVYQSGKTQWALCQISIDSVKAMLERHRTTAINNVIKHIDSLDVAVKTRQSSKALIAIFKGYRVIKYVQFENLRIKYKHRFIDCRQKLNWEFQLISNRLRAKARQDTVQLNFPKEKSKKLDFKFFHALVKADRVPLNGLPVTFAIHPGKSKYTTSAYTDSLGRASCYIYSLSNARAGAKVSADLDFQKMAGQDTLSPLLNYFMQGSIVLGATTWLTLPGKSVYLSIDEKSYGKESSWNFSQLVMEAFLDSLKIRRESDPAAADFMINIKSHSKRGSGTYGIFYALVKIQITLIDRRTGKTRYHKEMNVIKGEGNTFSIASMNALQNAAERLQILAKKELEKLLQ